MPRSAVARAVAQIAGAVFPFSNPNLPHLTKHGHLIEQLLHPLLPSLPKVQTDKAEHVPTVLPTKSPKVLPLKLRTPRLQFRLH